MNILALDYGTKTGYCYGNITTEFPEKAGTWTLGTPKEIKQWGLNRRTRTRDPRIARLANHLRVFPLADAVVFEDVQFASSTYQVQLWASLRAVSWTDYPDNVAFECVPVGTLKKFATGSGTASKEQMGSALSRKHTQLYDAPVDLDDNAIDAIWIWLWAKQNLARRA